MGALIDQSARVAASARSVELAEERLRNHEQGSATKLRQALQAVRPDEAALIFQQVRLYDEQAHRNSLIELNNGQLTISSAFSVDATGAAPKGMVPPRVSHVLYAGRDSGPPAQHPDRDSSDDSGQINAIAAGDAFKKTLAEINKNGITGAGINGALESQMRNSQVLAFAETHDNPNPLREFGASIMQGLKESGATHFVIEANRSNLPDAIAQFNKDGDLEKLKSQYPEESRSSDSYFAMLKAARDAGLTIVAAGDDKAAGTAPDRDVAMAKTISDILSRPNETDPHRSNKVVFWAGSAHLSGASNSAASVMRANGLAISTVEGVIPAMRDTKPIASALPGLSGRTFISTKDAPGLASIPTDPYGHVHYESEFDYHLFFPN